MHYSQCISSLEPWRNVSKVTSNRYRSRRQSLTLKQDTKSRPASRSSLPDPIMSHLLPGEIFVTMSEVPSFRLERVRTIPFRDMVSTPHRMTRLVPCELLKTWKVLAIQRCPILCDPMDCCPPGSSVHGILQERILEWVAIPSSRGSSRPGNRT